MIPTFPTSKKLDISDRTDVINFTSLFPPYSDFNFSSLYAFNTKGIISIAVLHNNLVVLFEDYITSEPFYSFLGDNNPRETIETIIAFAKKEKIKEVLQLVPEICIKSIQGNDRFSLQEDPDNNDYILSVDALAHYVGNIYYDKRNLVNRFKKQNPQHEVRFLDITQKNIQESLIDLFFVWEEKRGKKRSDTEHELKAIQRLFSVSDNLPLICMGIFVENVLVAFTIQEILSAEYAIIHFEKCNISFDGISSLLRQESAKFLQSKGCKYINFEQDLGIPGLKKAKMLWRPLFFLKKYTVSLTKD